MANTLFNRQRVSSKAARITNWPCIAVVEQRQCEGQRLEIVDDAKLVKAEPRSKHGNAKAPVPAVEIRR